MKHDAKVKCAIKRMGDRYVGHPVNRVKRLDTPFCGTDIRHTFSRQEAPMAGNVTRILVAK